MGKNKEIFRKDREMLDEAAARAKQGTHVLVATDALRIVLDAAESHLEECMYEEDPSAEALASAIESCKIKTI